MKRNQLPLTIYLRPELQRKVKADADAKRVAVSALVTNILEAAYEGINVESVQPMEERLDNIDARVSAIERQLASH